MKASIIRHFDKHNSVTNEGGTMKKLVGVILCAVLIIAMFASCASQNDGGSTSTPAPTQEETNGTASAAAAEPSDSGKEEYRIQILRDAGSVGRFTSSDLTAVGKVIKDKFNIVFEYIPYTGDMREKQNLMLAGGDYNEIQYMQRDDIVTAYIGAGALLDLGQFKDIMPNFWDRFGEVQIPYWSIVGNGTLYKWETGVLPLGELDIEANDIAIRTDVLEYYGWPNPVSTSEWIKLLKQAMIDFPEINGQPTVGITAPFAEAWGLQGIVPILYEKGDTYLPLSNEGYTYNVKTEQFEDYFQNKYVKESLKFFNELYREGLLDEEAFTDTSDRVIEKTQSGVALSVWYCHGWIDNNAIAQVAPERQYVNLPVQSDSQVAEGQKRLIRKETTRNFDSYGITKNARYPERIAELVDWAMSDEGQITIRNGVEGIHWERDASGKRVFTELGMQAARDGKSDINLTEGLNVYTFLGSFNQPMADGQFPNLFSHADIYDEYFLTDRLKETYAGLGWANSKGWWIDNMALGYTGLAGAVYIDSTTDLGKIHQQMTEVRLKWSAKMMMAKDDTEFEDLYQQAMAEYNMLDHESVINEYNRLLAEAKSQLG